MKNFNIKNSLSYKLLFAVLTASLVFVSVMCPASAYTPTTQPSVTERLTSDIVGNTIVLPAGKQIVTDGQGHTISSGIIINLSEDAATSIELKNIVFDGGNAAYQISTVGSGKLDLTVRNCTFKGTGRGFIEIPRCAESLVIDSCSFLSDLTSTYPIKIELRAGENKKLELTNNIFSGTFGTDGIINIAQYDSTAKKSPAPTASAAAELSGRITKPVKVSGNTFGAARYNSVTNTYDYSGTHIKLGYDKDAYSSDFGLNISGNKSDITISKSTSDGSKTEKIRAYSSKVYAAEVTANPDVSAVPTEQPTAVPTEEPTAVPTEQPTAVPTEEPTAVPTEQPTADPTEEPTAVPTEQPTAVPTEEPTAIPTEQPTADSSADPAINPTEEPTAAPTVEPIVIPIISPEPSASCYPLDISIKGSGAGMTGVLVYVNGALAEEQSTELFMLHPGDIVALSPYVSGAAKVKKITVNGVEITQKDSFIMPNGRASAEITANRSVYSPNSGLSTVDPTPPPMPTAAAVPVKTPRPVVVRPTQPPETRHLPFADVYAWDWFYDDVCAVYDMGLMNGTSSMTFEPDSETTRAMLVTILYRMEGSPKVVAYTPFYDVPQGTWYTDAVDWAFKNKIVNGMGDGSFSPDLSVTREEMATIFYRYMKSKGLVTTDAWAIQLNYKDTYMISDWAAEGVMYCTLSGIMQGNDDGTFGPRNTATRAEIAAVVNRTSGKLK